MNQQNNLDDLERILEQRPSTIHPVKRVVTRKARRSRQNCGCILAAIVAAFVLVGIVLLYLFFPTNPSLLVIGLDRALDNSAESRSDSIIYAAMYEMEGTLTTYSIPRDLWVTLPDGTENRINAAHFFAEINVPGSGPDALISTLAINFRLETDYYIRMNFEGFVNLVDAIGGVEITLQEPTAILPAGTHLLNGEQALAFVRDRKASDDFFRMERGGIFLKAFLEQALSIHNISKWPELLTKIDNAMDTNIPAWQIPRMLFVLLRALPDQVNSHTLPRESTQPFTTEFGAQVLLPLWDLILPELQQIFP